MNQLLVPDHSISAMRSSAAAECSTGSDTRLRMDPKMTASRSVQLPAWHSGSSRPCDSAHVISVLLMDTLNIATVVSVRASDSVGLS